MILTLLLVAAFILALLALIQGPTSTRLVAGASLLIVVILALGKGGLGG